MHRLCMEQAFSRHGGRERQTGTTRIGMLGSTGRSARNARQTERATPIATLRRHVQSVSAVTAYRYARCAPRRSGLPRPTSWRLHRATLGRDGREIRRTDNAAVRKRQARGTEDNHHRPPSAASRAGSDRMRPNRSMSGGGHRPCGADNGSSVRRWSLDCLRPLRAFRPVLGEPAHARLPATHRERRATRDTVERPAAV